MNFTVLQDALEKQKGCQDSYDGVFAMMDRMIEYATMARTYGLLALYDAVSETLDEAVKKPEHKNVNEYPYRLRGAERISTMMGVLTVDGMSPERIADMAQAQYFASDLQGREALAACMAIEGWMLIQDGWNPTHMRLNLLTMLPEEIADQYIERAMDQKKSD